LFKGSFTAETWRKLTKSKNLGLYKKKAAVIMAEYNVRRNKSSGKFSGGWFTDVVFLAI